MVAGHRTVQGTGEPIHVDPYIGRLSSQVKERREAMSARPILGIIHLSAKNAQEYLGAQKNTMEDLSINYKLTLPVWSPTGHIIFTQM
jgi:hypothetical protein